MGLALPQSGVICPAGLSDPGVLKGGLKGAGTGPYYLAAAKGGAKVYSLLRRALSATDRVAVGTFVMHQRQHLCVIAPSGASLMLLTLRFAEEIVPESASAAEAKVSPAELSMAKQLVEKMSGKFTPGHFKDTYRSDLKRRRRFGVSIVVTGGGIPSAATFCVS